MIPTIANLIRQGISQLDTCSDSARLDCESLLAHALGCNRTYLMAWPEKEVDRDQLTHFNALLNSRLEGEPVAYLLGRREFWSLDLNVTTATLIPRPETEHLVEIALTYIPETANYTIADLGTGSGAIALAIAKERPNSRITATDLSEAALSVAEQNARNQKISNISFIAGHWFEPLLERRFHLILSNPPYIAQDDPHLTQGDVRYEPMSALCSGPDGLDDIRKLIEYGREHLHPKGRLILEHGYNQRNAVQQLFEKFGYDQIHTHRDYAGNDRVTEARWPDEGASSTDDHE